MIEYLRNILPRVQQYSKSLDHKENYVDKPWVFIDGNNSTHEYEFCRDGRLIMSIDGQAQFGKWEYRQATQRLLIERPNDAIILQNAFINDGLMILKKSASEDPAFILINRIVVPDLDYISYLQRYIDEIARNETINRPQVQDFLTSDTEYHPSNTYDIVVGIVVAVFVFALIYFAANQ